MISGPVAASRTPFDCVVALGADPQTQEGREALFELRFPDDLARFPEMLPLVVFVCGSPLLEPEINIQRFFDIEPDQVEQIVDVFAPPHRWGAGDGDRSVGTGRDVEHRHLRKLTQQHTRLGVTGGSSATH